MTRAHVLQRLDSVHVGCTRKHSDAVVPVWIVRAVEVRGVVVVHDRIRDLKVHSAQLVDQLHEAVEAYPRVVVDVDLEVAFDNSDRALGAVELVRPADLAHAVVWNLHPQVAWDREHGGLLGGRVDADQDHGLRVQLVGDELGVVIRTEEEDGERLRLSRDRVEVGQAARDRARRGRGLEHGQEIRSQAGHSREEKTKDDDPDAWHVNLRPSSRATLERSRKPVPPVGCALPTR